MPERYLVTGGAGFIGSHIVNALLAAGHEVVVIDNRSRPCDTGELDYLADTEYIWANLTDLAAVEKAVRGVDVVVHQAARVGAGQSMFEIKHYIDDNVSGTATLLQAIIGAGTVRKIVLASSMSVYGEGLYECPACGSVRPAERSLDRLAAGLWEQTCPNCGREVGPLPTPEDAALAPASVYGVSKRNQEELCVVTGRAYEIATTCFRYFGVYGRRQLLTNPYTGIVAMFAARLVNRRPPLVFEDGRQIRDLIHVSDVCDAVLAACPANGPEGVFNLGTGAGVTVARIVEILAEHIAVDVEPEIPKLYRKGDIRHCFGDMRRFRAAFGTGPGMSLEAGLRQAAEWAIEHAGPESIDLMRRELVERRLLI
jgi:dTDP-L-rhamnose 4-epimerase